MIELSRYEKALGQFEKARNLLSKDTVEPRNLPPEKRNEILAKILSNIAVANAKLGKDGLALRNIGKALNHAPNNAVYFNNKGDFHLELENYDDAIKSYNSAIKLKTKPKPWRSYMGLAKAHINLGDKHDEDWMYTEALANLKIVKEIFPDIIIDVRYMNDYYYQCGYAHAKLGELTDTKKYFMLCKDDPKADRNLIRVKQGLKTVKPSTRKFFGGLIVSGISGIFLIYIIFLYVRSRTNHIKYKSELISEKTMLALIPILLGFIAVGICLSDIKSFTGPGGIGFESETTITAETVMNFE